MVVNDCIHATEGVSVKEEEKYVKICQNYNTVWRRVLANNVLSGNRSVREFVCHIMLGSSN